MPYDPMRDPAALPDSYWAATSAPLLPLPHWEGHLDVDVAIVGGGFTGLSTALHLAETGVSVAVFEAREPGWGASGRNNGQVVAALKHEPDEVIATFGEARGRALIDFVGGGPDAVFALIERLGIACEARRCGILTVANSAAGLDGLARRTRIWQDIGAPLSMLDHAATRDATGSPYYIGANLDPRGGSLNPLAYARGLAAAAVAAGARVLRDSPVADIARDGGRWRLHGARGTAVAHRVIVATNAYTGDQVPRLKRSILPVRSPQVVSAPLDPAQAAAILPGGHIMCDTRHPVVGVRRHPDGRLHLGGKIGCAGAERASHFRILQDEVARLFPQLGPLRWDYTWTGFVAMSQDRYPHLHEIEPGLAALLGYSGRGIAMATRMGEALAGWAAGRVGIDELPLPATPLATISYYDLRGWLIDANMLYHRARERLGHRLARRDLDDPASHS